MSSNLIWHPVQVAEWSNAEVCKTSYRGFESHPELLIQNRLIGRSAPFEGVRLGSNPSSGTRPCSPIGRGNRLRIYLLEVRVLSRTPCWIGVIGSTTVSKTVSGGSSPYPFAYPLNSVDQSAWLRTKKSQVRILQRVPFKSK